MRLPAELDSRLLRTGGLTLFEYHVLAMLSESQESTLPMSELAVDSYSSLSRLSHVVKKLEQRDLVRRRRATDDARVTVVDLTEAGWELIRRLAPEHVEDVRETVFDALDERDVADLARVGRKLVAWRNPEHWSLKEDPERSGRGAEQEAPDGSV